MNLKKIGLLATVIIMAITVSAQSLVGDWKGTLTVQGVELELIFHVEEADDAYTATMDVPLQNAIGIPVEKTVGAVVKTDMSLMWHGKVPLLGAALGSGMANVIMTYLSSRLPGGYLYPITLGSVVVLVSLFSILVLKEKPSKPGLIGILIGLVAIVVTNL